MNRGIKNPAVNILFLIFEKLQLCGTVASRHSLKSNDTSATQPTCTSSEVAPVLEATADTASLAGSATASKLIFVATAGAATHASPAPLGCGAALVRLLLSR